MAALQNTVTQIQGEIGIMKTTHTSRTSRKKITTFKVEPEREDKPHPNWWSAVYF